jgi:hypothetical protein
MVTSYFPLPINGEWSDDERHFTLDTPFVYRDESKDITVVVPAGFTTDFNSVPRAIWGYFPPWQYLKAGLVHDWLYGHPARFQSPSLTPPLTRQQCDDIHRRILDLEGCRWSKRQLVYAALRIGGGPAWAQHREEA